LKYNALTILAAGTFVRGDLFSQDTLVVEGGVQGNVVGDRVIVKASGWVKGSLTCRSLSIELGGIVEGQVQVTSQDALPRPAEAERSALDKGTNTLVLGDTNGSSLKEA
jgi:bactofilin